MYQLFFWFKSAILVLTRMLLSVWIRSWKLKQPSMHRSAPSVYLTHKLICFIQNILLLYRVKIPSDHHVPVHCAYLHFVVQFLKGFLKNKQHLHASYKGPALWNNLPNNLKMFQSTTTFKLKLKNYLIDKIYIQDWRLGTLLVNVCDW